MEPYKQKTRIIYTHKTQLRHKKKKNIQKKRENVILQHLGQPVALRKRRRFGQLILPHVQRGQRLHPGQALRKPLDGVSADVQQSDGGQPPQRLGETGQPVVARGEHCEALEPTDGFREAADGVVAELKGFQRLQIAHRRGETRESVSLVAETRRGGEGQGGGGKGGGGGGIGWCCRLAKGFRMLRYCPPS